MKVTRGTKLATLKIKIKKLKKEKMLQIQGVDLETTESKPILLNPIRRLILR